MIPVIPWYITLVVSATGVAIAVSLWIIVSRAAGRSDLPPADRRRVRLGTAVFLGVWLGAALLFAPPPASVQGLSPFALAPQIPLFAAASFVTVAIALWRSASLRHALSAGSLPLLIGAQAWRAIGIVFIILLAQGQLPAHFALPAGWGDVAIGLTAPLVGIALARGLRGARALAFTWNAVGLLDLVVAVGMGTGMLAPLLMPELGPRVPAAAAMGVFPMILIPTFAVPVAMMMHLIAIGLLAKRRPEPRLAPATR
jgi:hypothetical protein